MDVISFAHTGNDQHIIDEDHKDMLRGSFHSTVIPCQGVNILHFNDINPTNITDNVNQSITDEVHENTNSTVNTDIHDNINIKQVSFPDVIC